MTLTHREVLWFVFCVSLFFLCTLSVMTTLIHFPDVLALPWSYFQGFPVAWCLFRTSEQPLAVRMHLQGLFPFFNLSTISFDLWNLTWFFSQRNLWWGISAEFFTIQMWKYHKLSWAVVENKVQVLSLQAQHNNHVDGVCWHLEFCYCRYSFPLLGVR